jgi:hypothetical protein
VRYWCPLADFVEGAVDEVHPVDGGVVSGGLDLVTYLDPDLKWEDISGSLSL